MTRAPALRAPPRGSAPFLAFGLALLSVGLLLSEGPVRNAAAQQRPERETQEEVAPCRVVTGETGAPAGRTTMGGCARAIQAGDQSGSERLLQPADFGASPIRRRKLYTPGFIRQRIFQTSHFAP